MTEALFGLVGVVLGGAITGWTTYAMERRQERASARVAARLVREDLLPATLLLEDLLSGAEAIGVSDLPNPDVWFAERARLARVLSYSDYAAVAQAVYRHRQFAEWLKPPARLWLIGRRGRGRLTEREISDEQRSTLRFWLEDLSRGLGALLTVARGDF